MARAKKNTVEYFPHNCKHGRTLRMFESKYPKGVGYSFWFKLLEILGDTPDHYYDFQDKYNKQWLSEYCLGDPEKIMEVKEMLDCLGDLNAIDLPLFENDYLIWSQNFVDNLDGVYQKRTNDLPTIPIRSGNPAQVVIPARKSSISKQSATEKHQSKLKDTKVKDTRIISQSKFKIPTKKEFVAYAEKKGIPIPKAGDCFYYYEKIGWTVGKDQKPMVSWKAALSGWWNREKQKLER